MARKIRRDQAIMKRLYNKGATYRDVARKFKVSLGTAYRIINTQLDPKRKVII